MACGRMNLLVRMTQCETGQTSIPGAARSTRGCVRSKSLTGGGSVEAEGQGVVVCPLHTRMIPNVPGLVYLYFLLKLIE